MKWPFRSVWCTYVFYNHLNNEKKNTPRVHYEWEWSVRIYRKVKQHRIAQDLCVTEVSRERINCKEIYKFVECKIII